MSDTQHAMHLFIYIYTESSDECDHTPHKDGIFNVGCFVGRLPRVPGNAKGQQSPPRQPQSANHDVTKSCTAPRSSHGSPSIRINDVDSEKAAELRSDFRAWLEWRKADNVRANQEAAHEKTRAPLESDDPLNYRITNDGVQRRSEEENETFKSWSAKQGINWMQIDPSAGII